MGYTYGFHLRLVYVMGEDTCMHIRIRKMVMLLFIKLIVFRNKITNTEHCPTAKFGMAMNYTVMTRNIR